MTRPRSRYPVHMARFRDVSNDPTPRSPMHGPENFLIQEQGYQARTLGPERSPANAQGCPEPNC